MDKTEKNVGHLKHSNSTCTNNLILQLFDLFTTQVLDTSITAYLLKSLVCANNGKIFEVQRVTHITHYGMMIDEPPQPFHNFYLYHRNVYSTKYLKNKHPYYYVYLLKKKIDSRFKFCYA